MDKKPNSEHDESPRKAPAGGNNVVWPVLALVVMILVLVSLMGNRSEHEIPLLKLIELIEQGRARDAKIDVEEGTKDRPMVARYSNVKNLVVGHETITGTIDRQPLRQVGDKGDVQKDVKFLTNRGGLVDDGYLFELFKSKGFDYVRAEGQPSAWRLYMPVFLIVSLFILAFFWMIRRLGGTGSAIAFGRSRGKLVAAEDIDITFNDVAGIEEAVDELREVVEFLRSPDKYRVLGGRIPKGVLLVGPPGTGKTLLARAVAGEAGVPFFSLSGSDFVEMFVGVGAARVRDMFQQAETKAPCIVFIDELDALGKTRGTSVVGGHDEREQTLNALLVEMDGFSPNNGVIIMAATNRPETLDPALLRPGRFDRHVLVDRPDIRGREAILKVHTAKVKLDASVDIAEIAAITSGFVGADLANLVNEAALLAARKNKPAVTMDELTEAVERVTAGLEKKQRVMHDDEKHRVAYHEAAHALVAYSLPNTDPVHKVSIIPRGLAALGYTMQRPEGDRYLLTQSELESRVQVLLAGTVAEEMIFDDVSTGAQNDLERATDIARSMVMDFGMSPLGRVTFRKNQSRFMPAEFEGGRNHSEQTAREIDEEIRHIIDRGLERVRQILENRRPALMALTERLLEKEVIDTDELRAVIEANSPSPAIVPGTEDVAKRPARPRTGSSGAEPAEGGAL